MSLMDREKHEELLSELLSPETDTTRKTEILQDLRSDHVAGHESTTELTATNEKFKKNNDDLIISNSQMFRQLGVVGDKNGQDEEIKEKEYSETVTLTELEKDVDLR